MAPNPTWLAYPNGVNGSGYMTHLAVNWTRGQLKHAGGVHPPWSPWVPLLWQCGVHFLLRCRRCCAPWHCYPRGWLLPVCHFTPGQLCSHLAHYLLLSPLSRFSSLFPLIGASVPSWPPPSCPSGPSWPPFPHPLGFSSSGPYFLVLGVELGSPTFPTIGFQLSPGPHFLHFQVELGSPTFPFSGFPFPILRASVPLALTSLSLGLSSAPPLSLPSGFSFLLTHTSCTFGSSLAPPHSFPLGFHSPPAPGPRSFGPRACPGLISLAPSSRPWPHSFGPTPTLGLLLLAPSSRPWPHSFGLHLLPLALVPHLCLLMPRCVLPPPSFHWLSAPVPSASLLPLALVPHLLPLALLGLHFALLALSLRALCLPPTLCPWPLAPVPSASPLPPGTRAPPPCPWPFGP